MNICPRCRSSRLSSAGKVASVPWKICRNCDFTGEAQEFRPETVFDRITQSVKALAPKLVYRSFIHRQELRGTGLWLEWRPIRIKCYKSKIIPGAYYKNSTEAIAATVKELEKVIK